MNIVLIGYRSSGKSTVGRRLANLLGMKFLDIDEMIEERHKKSIYEIVKSNGWDNFREIERKIIEEISDKDNLVIAPGGGAVLLKENVEALKKNGIIIWLMADFETIRKRIEKDDKTIRQRPSLTGKEATEEIEEVIRYREPFYKNSSDVHIDTSQLNVEEVVREIISILKERRASRWEEIPLDHYSG